MSAHSLREEEAGLSATVLWHPDLSRIGASAWLDDNQASRDGISRQAPWFCDGEPLAHKSASRSPLHIHRRGAQVELFGAKAGLRFAVEGQPVEGRATIEAAALAGRGVQVALGRRGPLLLLKRGRLPTSPDTLGMQGASAQLAHVRAEIVELGPLPFPVLIQGQTGTGKELVAHALHASSGRAGPLVVLNVAALPDATATSQLFGHARGSFTGAAEASRGYFGDAEGGTLFLDEIGAASLDLQAKLLRVLESKEVQPIGGPVRRVDVRVLAATDEDLDDAIAKGHFRRPLLHRLAHGRIRLPPLALRPADLAVQFMTFARACAHSVHDTRLPQEWIRRADMERLLAYGWPGNSRELRAVAEQCASKWARAPHCRLPELGEASDAPVRVEPAAVEHASEQLDEVPVSGSLEAALAANDYRLTATAGQLGIGRNTLKRRMDALGIPRATELDAERIAQALTKFGSVREAARWLRVSERGLVLRMRELGLGPTGAQARGARAAGRDLE